MTLASAFAQAAAVVRTSADALVVAADKTPSFNIARAPSAVSMAGWNALEEPLALFLAGLAEVILDPPVATKARRDLAKQLAGEWAQTRAAVLVKAIGAETREAIRDAVADGMRANRSVPGIARSIRDTIGLTPRAARTVARMRARLAAEGLSSAAIDKKVDARVQSLIAKRASLIAATETTAAREQGKLAAWSVQIAEGKLPADVMRKWVGRDPCDVCMAIDGSAPVRMGQPFPSPIGPVMAPPIHPRCKCKVVLVPSTATKAAPTFRALVFAPIPGLARTD